MKTTRILQFFALLFFFSTSWIHSSHLHLTLFDDSKFTAIINNTQYNQPSNYIEAADIPAGSSYIKILNNITQKNPAGTTLYEGYIKIPDNTEVYASIDASGNLIIYKQTAIQNIQAGGHQHETKGSKCECNCEMFRICKFKDDGSGYHENNFRAMNPYDFAEFKKLISDRTFESTKLDMTKSVIDINYFTVDQVRDMLSWFVFESNKLDLAKYAFKNTVDRNYYYKLFDIFVFESNVVDLDSYIKNYK